MNCGCGNPWNNSVRGVCGTFEKPTVPDGGKCSPHHIKITCEAPVLPVPQCADNEFTVVPLGDSGTRFGISARIFSECCLPITDESNSPITGVIDGSSGLPQGTCPE